MYNIDSNKDQSLASIFAAEGHLLDADQQADLVQRARANDSEAFVALGAAHARLLRKHRALALKVGVEKEEAEDLLLLALTEAIMQHDVESHVGALAGLIRSRIIETLDAHYADNNTPFTLTRMHYYRYKALVNAHSDADKPIAAAYEATEDDPTMKPSTFLAIYHATRGTSLDLAGDDGGLVETSRDRMVTDLNSNPFDQAEDAVLVRAAFDAVDDDEERVISLRYGFRGLQDDAKGINYAPGETIPQAVIGKVMGLSQPTVNRRAAAGLSKMRKALGVTAPTAN